jgi:hypothetical protein
MLKTTSNRTLVWVIVVLLVTNLSMGLSFMYHKWQDSKAIKQTEKTAIDVPAEQRTKFFREQLNLTPEQVNQFRELNRTYNRSARDITMQLDDLRAKMVDEMANAEPNQQLLDTVTINVGALHTQLKKITIGYYTGMKAVCDDDQKIKLNEIFKSMLKQNEDVKLPGRQGRYGWRKNNSDTK